MSKSIKPDYLDKLKNDLKNLMCEFDKHSAYFEDLLFLKSLEDKIDVLKDSCVVLIEKKFGMTVKDIKKKLLPKIDQDKKSTDAKLDELLEKIDELMGQISEAEKQGQVFVERQMCEIEKKVETLPKESGRYNLTIFSEETSSTRAPQEPDPSSTPGKN
jgi:hypothetical protein